jgi:hypothetical protein
MESSDQVEALVCLADKIPSSSITTWTFGLLE